MPFVSGNGYSIRGFSRAKVEAYIRAWGDDIFDAAEGIMVHAADQGAEAHRQFIETTTSKTGQERAANGGHPGRVETGEMLMDVDHEVEVHRKGDGTGTIVGRWGFIKHYQDYYGIQETAEGMPFAPIDGLPRSMDKANDILISGLDRITGRH